MLIQAGQDAAQRRDLRPSRADAMPAATQESRVQAPNPHPPVCASPQPKLKILIADDDTTTRLMLSALASRLGHRTVQAHDGLAAVSVFAAERPDLVLMDRQMPGMDGHQAMMKIRAIASERWVPILFVTADGDVESQVSLLEQGADDYLVKPVNAAILRAKLDVMGRMLGLHREIENNNRTLRSYRDANENEMRVVKHLMSRMVHQDHLSDPMLDHWILPAANLSGDLVAAARTPRGVLHVMLADGTGHGLAAALNVLPITPGFYTMTAKGVAIEAIAATLNRTIRQQLPTDRFVASTLIAVDYAARRVKIWNGGNPPLLVLDAGGEVLARFPARNLALGILPAADFVPELDVFDYAEPCQLFACSDGVFEIMDSVCTDGGEAAVTELLQLAAPRVRMKLLRSRLVARNAESPSHDDMTLVLVQCGGAAAEVAGPVAPAPYDDPPPSRRFEITLGPADMRKPDVVPMLLELAATLPATRARRDELSVVLSELYSNALDHGVLMLESSLKNVGELDCYMEARAAALRDLADGSITIRIEAFTHGSPPQLAIEFRDSGEGYNFGAFSKEPRVDNGRPHGRGLALVRALCSSVEVRGRGNDVRVCFALDKAAAPVS
jgi:CheY-like chemotaxis protein